MQRFLKIYVYWIHFQGIPRNLSESQLLQIGSKALSNVAGQFSKLGQSLNPTKIRSGAKPNRNNSNPHIVYNPSGSIDAAEMATEETGVVKFTLGGDAEVGSKQRKKGNDSSSDSDENDCSIYEPDVTDLVQENPIYNENAFLPSVGIVMASNDVALDTDVGSSKVVKRSSDVCTMSISSVTDHIIMPAGMLENASPIRARSPAPEIRVDNVLASGSSTSHSSMDVRNDGDLV